MNEYLSVWDGRTSLTGDWPWQRQVALLRAAPAKSDFLTVKEQEAIPSMPKERWTGVKRGRPKGAKDLKPRMRTRREPATHCGTCAKPLSANCQRKGLVRCYACRKAARAA